MSGGIIIYAGKNERGMIIYAGKMTENDWEMIIYVWEMIIHVNDHLWKNDYLFMEMIIYVNDHLWEPITYQKVSLGNDRSMMTGE